MKKVLVIISNGFEDAEAIGAIDILRRGGVTVDVFGLNDTVVKGAKGTTVTNIDVFRNANINEYDCLLLPGGPHYKELQVNEHVINTIKYFYTEKKLIAAICAAPTILGKMGLLKGKRYTCFSSMNDNFGGIYINTYTVFDYPFITSKSVASCLDFGLVILKELVGLDVCNKVKESIYYND